MLIETDVGHDADDFFAICYLVAAGVKIDGIVVTPGDLDQLAVARFLSEELQLNVPIGAHKHSTKRSSGGMHHRMLEKYGYELDGYVDGSVVESDEFFVIGPPSNVGRYLSGGGKPPDKLTMQGGFLPYHLHEHKVERLEKFEDQDWVPTFNMNGDRNATLEIVNADIAERRFCGKNVCHTILLTQDKLQNFKPKCRASELFVEAAYVLFNRDEKYKNYEKKFHDPVAAVCHLHPEIGTWVRGIPVKMGQGWSTQLKEDGDYVLADINREAFWERLYTFS